MKTKKLSCQNFLYQHENGESDSAEYIDHLNTCSQCRLDLHIQKRLSLSPNNGTRNLARRQRAKQIRRAYHDLEKTSSKANEVPKTGRIAALALAAMVLLSLGLWSVDFREKKPQPTRPTTQKKIAAKVLAGSQGESHEFVEGANVEVGNNAIVLRLGTGVTAHLAARSKVVLVKLRKKEVGVRLLRGRLVFDVDPKEKKTVKVHTNQGIVHVRGTIFSVDAAANTQVSVLRGHVEFETAHRKISLSKGDVYNTTDKTIVKKTTISENESDLIALVTRTDCQPFVATFDSTPAKATLMLDKVRLGPAPFRMVLCAGSYTLSGTHPGFLPALLSVELSPKSKHFQLVLAEEKTEIVEHAEVTVKPKASPKAIKKPAPSPQELIREAKKARAEKRWKAASRIYRQVLREAPDSMEAKLALIALADLELGPLKRARLALGHYRAYQKQGGRLIVEASYGEINALKKLGRSKGEMKKIKSFLKRFPSTIRKSYLKGRLVELEALERSQIDNSK